MNRRILRLAIPNVISNITIPVLGLASIAIAGGLGSDEAIAAISVGTAIFSFIYWNCAFLRMGTSGLAAQALGARNLAECGNILVRCMVVALVLALLLLALQVPVGLLGMRIMRESETVTAMVAEYFFVRVWAAPATISLFALQGWFIGMQNSRLPMYISIWVNLATILFSYIFIRYFGMGVEGIAHGTVVAQYTGLALAASFWWAYYRRFLKYINWRESLRLAPMLRFFNVSGDIFIRSLCNTTVYTFFPVASAAYGVTMVATNTILIQLFTLFSYMTDGFGYAAEALVGRFTGAKNYDALRHSIRNMFWWCFGIAAGSMLMYSLFWRGIMLFFNASPGILEHAGHYIIWVMIVPLAGFAPFLMDGILIGATRTYILRNSMFVSTVLFFTLYYLLSPTLGNTALWVSFISFLVCRGVTQFFMSHGLKVLYR